MNVKLLNRLALFANELDYTGEYELADKIDTFMSIAGDRTRAVDDFIKELKKMFVLMADNPNVPSINRENLDIILLVIDTLADRGTFSNPSISSESINELQDEVFATAQEMKELNKSIQQSTSSLEIEKNPEEKKRINLELKADKKKLNQLQEKVKLWQNGQRKDDSEKYQKLVRLLNG